MRDKEDPALPEFWERRFREGITPWDAGGVPRALKDFLAAELPELRVLIPGCGSGYEIKAFAEAGHQVLAIDYTPAAIERAQQDLGPLSQLVQLADFFRFDYGKPYDLIYERAFLCALPRRLWPNYALRMAELLRPGGRLAGSFYFNDELRGPPFGLKPSELEALLDAGFQRVADAAVSDSLPVFAGKERWQVWARRNENS